MEIVVAILLIIFLTGTLIHFLRMCKIVKYYQKENEELSKMLDEMGEKQIPKKTYFRKEEGAIGYACPVCDMGVTADKGRIRDTYCSYCGQFLDWSKEE